MGESINQWFSIAMFDRRVILLWSGDFIIKMGTQPVKICCGRKPILAYLILAILGILILIIIRTTAITIKMDKSW